MQIGRNGSHLRCVSNYRVRSSATRNLQNVTSLKRKSSSSRSSSKTSTAANSSANVQNSVYKGIKTASDSVKSQASKLTDTATKSIFANAGTTKDTTEIVKNVKSLVRDYNSMTSNLRLAGSTVNNYFRSELSSYAEDNEKNLKAVGITIEKTGKLTIDEKRLEKANLEDLKKAFNGEGSFADKVGKICTQIATKASSDMNTKAYSSSTSNYRFSYRT